jgi:hypothetical protein
MGNDFLAKAKGLTRTFVFHSNTNRYAAAVAAGMMAVRSQQAGPYFHVSDDFIAMVDGLEAEEPNPDSTPDQIEMSFKQDWINNLQKAGLAACGLKYRSARTPEENTMSFLNAQNRRIPAKPRTVHESKELLVPPDFQADYGRLVALIQAGADLKPYLSRDVLKHKRADKNDKLLNSWGIQHLHFRSDGTDQLLFCMITESDVYMIQVLPHDAQFLWVNT